MHPITAVGSIAWLRGSAASGWFAVLAGPVAVATGCWVNITRDCKCIKTDGEKMEGRSF